MTSIDCKQDLNFIKTTMAIKNFFNSLAKNFQFKNDNNRALILNKNINYLFYFLLIILFFLGYNFFYTPIDNKNELKKNNLKELLSNSSTLSIKEYFLDQIKFPYKEYTYVIQNNDNIKEILSKYDISNSQIQEVINGLKEKKLGKIYSGKEFKILLKRNEEKKNSIINISYPVSNTKLININFTEGKFVIAEKILQLTKKKVVVKSTISNNLYSSAIKENIEPNIIIEFARIYGFEIDFQRDIWKGDTFKIFYEKYENNKGEVKDTGKIIFASMKLSNRKIDLYNFTDSKGEEGYYDINGKSIVKSLMKTPINGARLSSPFGMRKHPILGFNKLHTGTDFAAPTGTPIMASGSGTVTRARWCGGGGNCIKIKHNSTYQTVYAHMKNFAKGIKEGKKVKQGQIIGYVGSTGMSTGPHLHYEVIVNGKKVNSRKLKLPSGKILKGEERKEFEINRIKIDLELDKLKVN